MDIEFAECLVDEDKISLVLKFAATFQELQKTTQSSTSFHGDDIRNECLRAIADTVAQEYLEKHKMELVNSLSKEDIVNAIQLKIIEQFRIADR